MVVVVKTNTLNAAARCCFLYSLSSSRLSNLGYERILSFFPEVVVPLAPTEALGADSEVRVVAVGAILCRWWGLDDMREGRKENVICWSGKVSADQRC